MTLSVQLVHTHSIKEEGIDISPPLIPGCACHSTWHDTLSAKAFTSSLLYLNLTIYSYCQNPLTYLEYPVLAVVRRIQTLLSARSTPYVRIRRTN